MIGPWGREFSNLGQSMRQSNRKVISMLEPMMDVLGIRYWNLESSKDLGVIPEAVDYAFSESKTTAILVGAYTAWN
jgi:sulfopyruvate decarboxylase subunit alpha